MKLIAYIDESGTHAGSPVMAMGGYIGHAAQWKKFDKKWPKMLAAFGLKHFHTVEFVKRKNEFKLDRDTYELLLTSVERMGRQNAICGFVARLTGQDFKQFYLTEPKPTKIPLDTQYGFCFRTCLIFLIQRVQHIAGKSDVTVDLVLEAGHKNAGDAVRIFELFKRDADPEEVKLFGTLTFADKMDCYGTQLADSLVYSAYRQEQEGVDVVNVGDGRAGFEVAQARAAANGTKPVFRLLCSEPLLLELRQNLEEAITKRAQHWKHSPRPTRSVL